MPLFQHSVLKKYINDLDKLQLQNAWQLFSAHFLDPVKQENIRNLKEEQYQEGFVRDLFVSVLGYTLNPQPNYNFVLEKKTITDATKSDGAILHNGNVVAVIELKDTGTADLDKVSTQAFGYKHKHKNCLYVITSNFEKLRFYINDATDYEEFNLFTLSQERFAILYLCLQQIKLQDNVPLQLKQNSLTQEENVTKQLYADYSSFKRKLFQNIAALNTQYDKLLLFKKTQKLLDRFLFIFFAEDRLLLPPNSVREILKQWEQLRELDNYVPLYSRFKKYFGYLNLGHVGKQYEIFAYNGGLFVADEILDNIIVDDAILFEGSKMLSNYDFETDVDVNILGHIFEHSLTEIEGLQAELEGNMIERKTTKRKKDGVFYTPRYITKYIVENTIGALCTQQKEVLQINEETLAPKKRKDQRKILLDKIEAYRGWLLQLTICDPACGSGAFLNAALEYLKEEHRTIDELKARIFGDAIVYTDIDNSILENNLFGVDINEEAIEIARLSLWLHTAKKGRKLSNLSNNIKCGNSLIDDASVAGDKAFVWKDEFKTVFKEKDKKAFHITTATHDSRTSERMIKYKVRERRDHGTRPLADPEWLSVEEELIVTKLVSEIVIEDQLNVMAYNICEDHMHLLLVCEEEEVQRIMQKIKSKTARAVNIHRGTTREHAPLAENTPLSEQAPFPEEPGELPGNTPTREHAPLSNKKRGVTQHSLWTQKFGCKEIMDEAQLWNTIEYIRTNREKHELPPLFPVSTNAGAEDGSYHQQGSMLPCLYQDYEHAFRKEYKGGFDVVIGNPPYLRVQGLRENFKLETNYYDKTFSSATGRFDIYVLFIEKSFALINKHGIASFILPHKFMISDFGIGIRKFLIENKAIKSIVSFGAHMVFSDASTYTCILNIRKQNEQLFFADLTPQQLQEPVSFKTFPYKTLTINKWNFQDERGSSLFEKINSQHLQAKDVFEYISQGIVSVGDDIFVLKGKIMGDKFFGFSEKLKMDIEIEANLIKPLLKGDDVKKFSVLSLTNYIIYPHKDSNDKTIPLEETELQKNFPLGYNYLLNFKEELVKKKIRYKTNPKYWYSLHRAREISLFEQTKILTPETSFGTNMTLDETGYYHNTQVYSFVKKSNRKEHYKFLLCLLDSKLLWYFLKNTGTILRGGFFRFKTSYLENFPIPESDEIVQQPFIAKADIMLSKNKELNHLSQQFTQLLQAKSSTININKKLQNWYTLTGNEFLKELSKQKIKLPLSEQQEWLQYFEEQKTKANNIQQIIEQTDKEIDAMVYALYGLTEEEIEIVENS